MVCKERPTQNMGRVARAFNVFTHAAEGDEARSSSSAQIARGFTQKEEFNMEYLRYTAQLLVNRQLIK